MEGFKKFLLQGNLVQLAVAVVIGSVFASLISSFTEGFITPLLGIFGGVPTFGELYFTINGSQFMYGAFVDALISFLITAAILYFFVVMPIGKLMEKFIKAEDATTRECPHCYTDINKKASKCANCTSEVTPEVASAE